MQFFRKLRGKVRGRFNKLFERQLSRDEGRSKANPTNTIVKEKIIYKEKIIDVPVYRDILIDRFSKETSTRQTTNIEQIERELREWGATPETLTEVDTPPERLEAEIEFRKDKILPNKIPRNPQEYEEYLQRQIKRKLKKLEEKKEGSIFWEINNGSNKRK